VRVDAHVHVWDLAVRPQPWTDEFPVLRRSYGFAELAPQLAAAGVDRAVLVQTVADAAETVEFLALAAAEPLVGGVVGWLDLEDPGLADRVATLEHRRWLVGARHQLQVEPDPRWLARPDVRRGLGVLADAGLVWDLVVSPHQLPLVVETVRAVPQLRFVLDHGGNPPLPLDTDAGAAWCRDVAALAACPNAAVKLSGVLHRPVEHLPAAVDHLLAVFGPDRALFGSDWPVCRLGGEHADAVALVARLLGGLSAAERDRVLGGTARDWYRRP
jgi:L-fucono-1,5-lactonase